MGDTVILAILLEQLYPRRLYLFTGQIVIFSKTVNACCNMRRSTEFDDHGVLLWDYAVDAIRWTSLRFCSDRVINQKVMQLPLLMAGHLSTFETTVASAGSMQAVPKARRIL